MSLAEAQGLVADTLSFTLERRWPDRESGARTLNPLVTEKSLSAELQPAPPTAWRQYLESRGILSAIVALEVPGLMLRRHAYLVGFDDAIGNPQLQQWLLAYAEEAWLDAGHETVWTFSVADSVSMQPVIAGGGEIGPLRAKGLDQLASFNHALVAHLHIHGTVMRAIFFKPASARAFTAAERHELEEALPLFAEHSIARAELTCQLRQSAMLKTMLDRLSLPVFMLDANARPLSMSSAAEAMLGERRWLLPMPDGRVGCASPEETQLLRRAIRSAATASVARDGDSILRFGGQEDGWRLAYVLSAAPGAPRNSALLIVLSPDRPDPSVELLEALGLLPSEQRFLRVFLSSTNLGDAALACGISDETARTYMKRVRAKLGVSRQMELATLVSGLVIPLHPSQQA